VDASEPDSGAERDQQPAAAQAREYVQQVRSLSVAQVLEDVLFSLLSAAQVKLGRRDARLLIDVTAVAHEHARPYLPAELVKQIDQALGELRMAQVSAEGQPPRPGQPEQNDLDRAPAPPAAPPTAPQPPTGGASRLWVPGR
jgi:hypothetical protein